MKEGYEGIRKGTRHPHRRGPRKEREREKTNLNINNIEEAGISKKRSRTMKKRK